MKRILALIFFPCSVAGIGYAFLLVYEGTRPCGGDGCLTGEIFRIVALLLLLIFFPVFLLTFPFLRDEYRKYKAGPGKKVREEA